MPLSTPNLPQSKAVIVIADYRISNKIERSLKALNIEVIKTVCLPYVLEPVCGHPDMMCFYCGDGEIIIAPHMFKSLGKVLTDKGLKVLKGSTNLQRKYPLDIAYNAALIGDSLFCNEIHTDILILQKMREKQIKIIDIKQGYAKCSVCAVSEKAIITSDIGIQKRAAENGFEALFIDADEIRLEGFDNGFIGGCCGKISSNMLAFTGDIKKHRQFELIKSFCEKHNVDVFALSDEKLTDFGSLIPVFEEKT